MAASSECCRSCVCWDWRCHKSFSESVSANCVRFYCSLIIQMNALSCWYLGKREWQSTDKWCGLNQTPAESCITASPLRASLMQIIHIHLRKNRLICNQTLRTAVPAFFFFLWLIIETKLCLFLVVVISVSISFLPGFFSGFIRMDHLASAYIQASHTI